jgi:glycosyltransferase involved in cell wall biosynthesis
MADGRITVFLPGLHGGGAEKMMLDLSAAFSRSGHEVDMVVAKAEGAFVDDVPEPVELVDLDAPEPPGFNLLGALPGLVRYLRRRRPTVLLSALSRANVVAALAASTPGVDTRVVLSEHNHLSTYLAHASRRERLVLPRLMAATYPRADAVVCVSRGVATDLRSVCGLSPATTRVVYNAVITPELRAKYEEPAAHPWFTSDVPVVMGLGSLTEQKDFPTLVDAVRLARDERECRLVVCGAGERRAELEDHVAETGMADVVDLAGFVDNPYAMLNEADVFVLSSQWEGFGNVLVEALGGGCPVVSTDCPSGPAEILADGEYGELVPVGDADAMATAIERQLQDPPDRRRSTLASTSSSLEQPYWSKAYVVPSRNS